jgi:hypothetical protein
MFYAVTDCRIVIIKNKRIIEELPLVLIKNVTVKTKLFGNGTVVFNQGDDYFDSNIIEAPTQRVMAFFNVIDPENVIENL